MAATLDARLRAFVTERLPDGLDGREVAEIAREVAKSATPLTSLDAVLARYGDRFTVDGAQAFRTAATMLGDDGLAEVADVFAKSQAAVGAAREAAVEQTLAQRTIADVARRVKRRG